MKLEQDWHSERADYCSTVKLIAISSARLNSKVLIFISNWAINICPTFFIYKLYQSSIYQTPKFSIDGIDSILSKLKHGLKIPQSISKVLTPKTIFKYLDENDSRLFLSIKWNVRPSHRVPLEFAVDYFLFKFSLHKRQLNYHFNLLTTLNSGDTRSLITLRCKLCPVHQQSSSWNCFREAAGSLQAKGVIRLLDKVQITAKETLKW